MSHSHPFISGESLSGHCMKTVKRDAYVNRFGRLGWETERKVTPQSSLCRGNRGRRGAGRGGERGGRGEIERRGGKGLRCEPAHTGYFIEGNNRALRTDV